VAGTAGCSLNVPTEPYARAFFMSNGRSMPDDMDPTTPGRSIRISPTTAIRTCTGRAGAVADPYRPGPLQHPFQSTATTTHSGAPTATVIVSTRARTAAGRTAAVHHTTTPGLAMDGIFYWTGKGLNWERMATILHPKRDPHAVHDTCVPMPTLQHRKCPGDQLLRSGARTTISRCKRLRSVTWRRGPATLPDANLFTNGAWYGGSPYLGPDATVRCHRPDRYDGALGHDRRTPDRERRLAFMWHPYEREIPPTTSFGRHVIYGWVDSRES